MGSVGRDLNELRERSRKDLWKGEHKARGRNELGKRITKWQKPSAERAEGEAARERRPNTRPCYHGATMGLAGDAEAQALRA